MFHRPSRRRRLTGFGGVLLLATVCLAALTVPASADPQALSDEPTAELSCASGTSTLTIHWPAGEYGEWLFGGGFLADVGGPGGTFTSPTDEVRTVPDGWEPQTSTFRLNLDTTPGNNYNQVHVTPTGQTCPFSTEVTPTFDCQSGTLNTSVAAGHITSFTVFDDVTGAVIYGRSYPRYNLMGVLVEPIKVGPVTLSAPVPNTVERVRVEVMVDNTLLTRTLTLDCPAGCVWYLGQWANANAPGYPLQQIQIGSVTYTAAQAKALLAVGYAPIQYKLRRELLAAKLNQARGARYPGLQALLDAADASMTAHPTDAGMSAQARNNSIALRSSLDQYNRGLVPGVPHCSAC